MSRIRKAAVAGTFYPNDKKQLDQMVDVLLKNAISLDSNPKAIIAPHAGYIYSGKVAASAYEPLRSLKNKIKKIVLLGPSHHVSFDGLAIPQSDFFETPIGKVTIDQEAIRLIQKLPQISVSDVAHVREHSLEVHLPFLQKIFGDKFLLTPIVVGHSNPDEVGQVIEKLWGNDDTLIVISTDLSHYHTYEEAYQMDRETCSQVESLDLEQLHSQKMCGSLPVSGLLNVARKKKLQVKMVDFCNSGDIKVNNAKANKDRVVGYASFYCGDKKDLGDFISKAHKQELLNIARGTIEYGVDNNYETPEYLESLLNFDKETPVATFVTLEIKGKLRGCIGSLVAHRDILQDVAFNAYSAAFCDPRFPKLTKEELENLEISISILTTPQPLKFNGEEDLLKKIQPNIDGLILIDGKKQGTFLPSVWESLPNKKDFLDQLKVKSGLTENYWSNNIKIQRYHTVKFDESIL